MQEIIKYTRLLKIFFVCKQIQRIIASLSVYHIHGISQKCQYKSHSHGTYLGNRTGDQPLVFF